MRSHFIGRNGNLKWHMLHYFDGQRLRECAVMVTGDNVTRTEKTIPGVLELGMKYATVKNRLRRYEELCTRRVG